jgi:hypothetical protein
MADRYTALLDALERHFPDEPARRTEVEGGSRWRSA